MKCGYCGRELPDRVDPEREPCGRCRGGCRMIHCPYCGYANPAPVKLPWRRTPTPDGEE